jgi:hypothetical protein
LVAGPLGHPHEELVAGELEVLIGVRMGGQLARRIRLRLREEDEAGAADVHHRVLDL